jgi:hypothetical protein
MSPVSVALAVPVDVESPPKPSASIAILIGDFPKASVATILAIPNAGFIAKPNAFTYV